jgi:hypothetical protein
MERKLSGLSSKMEYFTDKFHKVYSAPKDFKLFEFQSILEIIGRNVLNDVYAKQKKGTC